MNDVYELGRYVDWHLDGPPISSVGARWAWACICLGVWLGGAGGALSSGLEVKCRNYP